MMKFLFRKRRDNHDDDNHDDTSARATTLTSTSPKKNGAATASNSNKKKAVVKRKDKTTTPKDSSSATTMHRQRQRRESLVDMDVPLVVGTTNKCTENAAAFSASSVVSAGAGPKSSHKPYYYYKDGTSSSTTAWTPTSSPTRSATAATMGRRRRARQKQALPPMDADMMNASTNTFSTVSTSTTTTRSSSIMSYRCRPSKVLQLQNLQHLQEQHSCLDESSQEEQQGQQQADLDSSIRLVVPPIHEQEDSEPYHDDHCHLIITTTTTNTSSPARSHGNNNDSLTSFSLDDRRLSPPPPPHAVVVVHACPEDSASSSSVKTKKIPSIKDKPPQKNAKETNGGLTTPPLVLSPRPEWHPPCHLQLPADDLLLERIPIPTTTTTTTDMVTKDHAFQLIPNYFPEFGMLHSDYLSIEAATHSQQGLPGSSLVRPILCVDAEIPGNVHAGQYTFSHPLLVEAIESLFVVVTNPLKALPQGFRGFTATAAAVQQPQRQPIVSTSKMGGNYSYTRVRILDPLSAVDLVPPLGDRQLTRASLIQALLDALAMVCPDKSIPRYLANLLEEEHAHAHHNYRRQDSLYHHHHHQNISRGNAHHGTSSSSTSSSQAPMAVFGMENTAVGEVIFAELDGVVSTQVGWVLPRLVLQSSSKNRDPYHHHSQLHLAKHQQRQEVQHSEPPRLAVICIWYDPQRLSYCTLAKFAVQQQSLGKLGRPSGLTLFHTSNEEQVAAQMHIRAHYRELMEQADPNNPARYYYSSAPLPSPVSSSAPLSAHAHETIRVLALQQEQEEQEDDGHYYYYHNDHHHHHTSNSSRGKRSSVRSSTSSNTTSSSEEFDCAGLNNSLNKTHPGYKVPDYDGVVEHAAAKAAAEATKERPPPKYAYCLKTNMSMESLQLQGSKPSLRESHLRFVPLTPFQATRANALVYQGKFHLAMQLLSPRQGMLLMHALRSGKPKPRQTSICCCDTTRRGNSNGGGAAPNSSNDSSPATSTVYQDVVDVPMLDAWEAFVLRPLLKDDDDDSLMGLYSEPRVVCYNHYTNRNDDGLSIFTNSTGGDL